MPLFVSGLLQFLWQAWIYFVRLVLNFSPNGADGEMCSIMGTTLQAVAGVREKRIINHMSVREINRFFFKNSNIEFKH